MFGVQMYDGATFDSNHLTVFFRMGRLAESFRVPRAGWIGLVPPKSQA